VHYFRVAPFLFEHLGFPILAAARCRALRPNETPEEALQRRLRETEQVLERVQEVATVSDWEEALAAAGDKLVVLEIESDNVCQTGLEEEVELQVC